jgi:hypothetical protein
MAIDRVAMGEHVVLAVDFSMFVLQTLGVGISFHHRGANEVLVIHVVFSLN